MAATEQPATLPLSQACFSLPRMPRRISTGTKLYWAYSTHVVVLEQLRDMLKAAKSGHGWAVERTVTNIAPPEELRDWKADLVGFDSEGQFVLNDATIKNLYAPPRTSPQGPR